MTLRRLEKLNALLQHSELDAIALNPGASLSYLSGVHFHLMERPVVLLLAQDQQPALILPELEMLKVEQIPYPVTAFAYGENPTSWQQAFASATQSLALDSKRIGVEVGQLRLLEYRLLQHGAPSASYPDASDTLAALRLCKEPDEIAQHRRAVQVAETALEALLPQIKIGVSERELAAELVLQLLRHGSDSELPFSPIVASGPNSANPHASPSARPLQAGELLVIDFGARSHGYISDITRTFAVGEVDAETATIHRVVQEANAAGRAAGKPGVPCAAVDAAARSVIEAAGYGEVFFHRTGHGIGLETHEGPYIRGDNTQLLEPGMAYTVEPGIYLAGHHGVRIEDDMLITTNGAESLTTLPREMRVVG